MRFNILAGNIRDVFLITKAFSLEDHADFASLFTGAIAFCAEKNSEFVRHVEPRKPGTAIKFYSRNVM